MLYLLIIYITFNVLIILYLYCLYNLRHLHSEEFVITTSMLQQHKDLLSIVTQLQSHNLLSAYARLIIDQMICSDMESKDGIKTTTDKAMGNPIEINVNRAAVLRQYFGMSDKDTIGTNSTNKVNRATYAVGSGSVSVGTDPHNYYTRDMNIDMQIMGEKLMGILRSNISMLNLEDVNLFLNFNHCTVLLYYADGSIKHTASLGPHCDCTYCPKSKKYESAQNSQVKKYSCCYLFHRRHQETSLDS